MAMGRADEVRELKRRGLRLYSVDYALRDDHQRPRRLSAHRRDVLSERIPAGAPLAPASLLRLDRRLRGPARGDRPGVAQRGLRLDDARPAGARPGSRGGEAKVRTTGGPADGSVHVHEDGRGERHERGGTTSALGRRARAVASREGVVGGRAQLIPGIRKGNPHRALAAAVREFCRRNRATLVVKSREKNRDPRFVRRMADRLVKRDDEVYPYTSMQLMSAADLCVHFQSGAVLEAAFVECRHSASKWRRRSIGTIRHSKSFGTRNPAAFRTGPVWSGQRICAARRRSSRGEG